MILLAVFVGGALGALTRAAIDLAFAGADPWPTVGINIAGCLAIGVLAGWLRSHPSPRSWWQPFVATGVLGGFTTMSAYAVHSWTLYESGQRSGALVYACLTLVGSLVAAAVGLRAGTRVAR